MKDPMKLSELPEGVIGEIISVDREDVFEQIGAHVGMTVIILNKAVDWLVQIGYSQLELTNEYANMIRVKPVQM